LTQLFKTTKIYDFVHRQNLQSQTVAESTTGTKRRMAVRIFNLSCKIQIRKRCN